jgi:hypothetical protein
MRAAAARTAARSGISRAAGGAVGAGTASVSTTGTERLCPIATNRREGRNTLPDSLPSYCAEVYRELEKMFKPDEIAKRWRRLIDQPIPPKALQKG